MDHCVSRGCDNPLEQIVRKPKRGGGNEASGIEISSRWDLECDLHEGDKHQLMCDAVDAISIAQPTLAGRPRLPKALGLAQGHI